MENQNNPQIQAKIRQFLDLLSADIEKGNIRFNSGSSESSETSETSESSEGSETTEAKEGGTESGGSENGGEYQQLLKHILATNPSPEEWEPLVNAVTKVLGDLHLAPPAKTGLAKPS